MMRVEWRWIMSTLFFTGVFSLYADTLSVFNQVISSHREILSFPPAEEIGLEIIPPVTGITESTGFLYQIEAAFHRSIDLEATPFLAIQVQKGNAQSFTYLPINHQKISGSVFLRFGSGEYLIRLLKPNLKARPSNQLHLTPLVEWKVTSIESRNRRDLLPQQGIESDHPTIQKLARALTEGATTIRQKAYLIYHYVATHLEYDVGKYQQNQIYWQDSALRILREKKAICQGYAFLATSLLRSVQIPARLIEGTVSKEPHVWVEAYVEGGWLSLDPTWGAGYLTKKGTFQKRYQSLYFDPSPSNFQNHRKERMVY